MSRDYKPAAKKNNGSKGSPFLTGLLVGLLLGVGLSLWVTMYLKGSESPFSESNVKKPAETRVEKPAEENEEDVLPKDESPDGAKSDNKFDFYTILPETEST